jgi:hypothetical protein
MVVHGTQTVLGHETSDAVSGIAGLGHTVLTVGLILLFVNLGRRLSAGGATGPAPVAPAEAGVNPVSAVPADSREGTAA